MSAKPHHILCNPRRQPPHPHSQVPQLLGGVAGKPAAQADMLLRLAAGGLSQLTGAAAPRQGDATTEAAFAAKYPFLQVRRGLVRLLPRGLLLPRCCAVLKQPGWRATSEQLADRMRRAQTDASVSLQWHTGGRPRRRPPLHAGVGRGSGTPPRAELLHFAYCKQAGVVAS